MNNSNVFRHLLFFLVCILIMFLFYWGLSNFFKWLPGLSITWFLLITILISGAIYKLFKIIAHFVVGIVSLIMPNKGTIYNSLSLGIVILGICLWYLVWNLKEDYSGWEIFVAIISTSATAGSIVGFYDGVKEAL